MAVSKLSLMNVNDESVDHHDVYQSSQFEDDWAYVAVDKFNNEVQGYRLPKDLELVVSPDDQNNIQIITYKANTKSKTSVKICKKTLTVKSRNGEALYDIKFSAPDGHNITSTRQLRLSLKTDDVPELQNVTIRKHTCFIYQQSKK